MKTWQIVGLVALVIAGIALVVYFATRREATLDASAPEGEGDSDAAEAATGIGNAATGLVAGIIRATGN